jgi:predicted phosphoribosyltransferase
VRKLSKKVHEVVCPLIPDEFTGVGGFYEDFSQVSDEEAIAYLDNLRAAQLAQ